MPRRKISIAEALQVLRENNLDVSVKPAITEFEQGAPITKVDKSVVRKVGNTAITIMLHNQHMIGSGGFLTKKSADDEGVMSGNTNVVYGPGQVTVPVTIASQLLYQDQLARQADERFLETRQRSYLVVQKRGYEGGVVNTVVQVGNGLLDSFNIDSRETMII